MSFRTRRCDFLIQIDFENVRLKTHKFYFTPFFRGTDASQVTVWSVRVSFTLDVSAPFSVCY